MEETSKARLRSKKDIAPKMKWTLDEDEILRVAVKKFNCKNWKKIASEIPGRTSKQCLERWYGKLNPDLLDTEFSKEEDEILVRNQKIFGNKWSKISHFLPGRSTISVRNRWDLLKRHEKNPSLNTRTKRSSTTATTPQVSSPEEDIQDNLELFDCFNSKSWKELDKMLQPNENFAFDLFDPLLMNEIFDI